MSFTRKWDSSCPRVWDAWEEAGSKWVVQDIAPEDDDIAIKILVEHFLDEEVLCSLSKITEDQVSLQSATDLLRAGLAQRMSLGCYTEIEKKKTLVALNICIVDLVEEKYPSYEFEGAAIKNVLQAMEYIENKRDAFKYLGVDKLMHGIGMIVKKEYRGNNLGSKILAAREPLCMSQGVKGSATVFTGPASQKSALRSGFETICVVSLKELAEHGLNYPKDENRVVKFMVKKFLD